MSVHGSVFPIVSRNRAERGGLDPLVYFYSLDFWTSNSNVKEEGVLQYQGWLDYSLISYLLRASHCKNAKSEVIKH